jgi:hypothetical protein
LKVLTSVYVGVIGFLTGVVVFKVNVGIYLMSSLMIGVTVLFYIGTTKWLSEILITNGGVTFLTGLKFA